MQLEMPNTNPHAIWRKLFFGAIATALMGYIYKQNEKIDKKIDDRYPSKRMLKKQQEEAAEDPS